MNKKKLRIYGAGGHSQVIREVLEENGCEITETFDDQLDGIHYATKNPASGARGDVKKFPHKGHPVIIAVGINSERAEIANFLKCKFEKAIHHTAFIANSVKLGEGTVVFAGAIIQPNTVIGKHVIVNTSASIDHDNIIKDFAHISPKVTLCGHVEVGEGTHVGANAVVIPKVKIGKWCTIGAGAVVIKDVPDYSTVVGSPGKVIKTSNKSSDKKKVRIYGAGGHSQVVREILEDHGYEIAETFDDKPQGSHYASKNITFGARGDLSAFPHEGHPVVIAVGVNKDRSEIANFLNSNFLKVIHKTAIIADSAIIGEGTVIIAGAIVNANATVGKHVLINTSASVGHDCIVGDFAHISPKVALCGHVEVGEGSHVGVGAVVIPKVKIGKWCTIGAGSVIINDVPDYTTVVGNPGEIIKKINVEEISDISKNTISDITFIGSGISSSYTILHLLKKIENNDLSKKIKIDVIEKYSEFNTGIPYGSRSGSSVLLITSLRDFLPELELNKFIGWLNNNKKWLLNKFKKSGGSLSGKWLRKHKIQLENNEWEDLFIPRCFFGVYMNERLKRKIEILERSNLVEVNYIKGEVIDVDKEDDVYNLHLKNDTILKAKKTILSVGSLPINYLWKKKRLIEEDNLLFVNNPYNPNLDTLLNKIEHFLESNTNKKANVLIVGTNASGLELLYKLNDIDLISCNLNKFTFLSTKGMIPNATVDKERKDQFIASNLIALEDRDSLTAKDIADAAYRDLDYAEEIKLGAASTVGKISSSFGVLLNKLNEKELKKFACSYGNEIGRRQRCAGEHYLEAIDKLTEEGRFKHVAGRFRDLKLNDSEFELEYLDTKTQEVKMLNEPINLVINCVGSMNFENENIPPLIKSLLENRYCVPNDSRIGFEVNNNFEASDNLHIIGPLLAGNIIDNKPIWHVEHCGRINWLSNILADKIVENV